MQPDKVQPGRTPTPIPQRNQDNPEAGLQQVSNLVETQDLPPPDAACLAREANEAHLLSSTVDLPKQAKPGSTTSAPETEELTATVINQRYMLNREIGKGGMGTVFEAADLQSGGKKVAVKMLHAAAQGQINQKVLDRFLREGKTMNKLHHPNILQCLEFNPEVPYLVMELMEGGSLKVPAEELKLEQKILVVADICGALHYAHENNLVHRDVKPGNILLSTEKTSDEYLQRPVAKLADFGLVMIPDATKVTASGEIMGSAIYTSPEQASGQRALISPLSDLYSIGIILYEIVTGVAPFDGGGELFAVLQQHQNATPEPISKHHIQTLPGLEPIIMSLLQKKPSDRFYKSGGELAKALRSIAHPRKKPIGIQPLPD